MLDGLLINLSLLTTGLFLVGLTYRRSPPRRLWLLSLLRYALTVATGLMLMTHSLIITPGLLFDFRTVLIALISRRDGALAGLLVTLPLAYYRWHLGGVGAWFGVANMLLVVVLASPGFRATPSQAERDHLYRKWWIPLRIFAVSFLVTLPPFWLTGQPKASFWKPTCCLWR